MANKQLFIIAATIVYVNGIRFDDFLKIKYQRCGCEKTYLNAKQQELMEKTGLAAVQRCSAKLIHPTLYLDIDNQGRYMLVGTAQDHITANEWFSFGTEIKSRRHRKDIKVVFTKLSDQKISEVQTLANQMQITYVYVFTKQSLTIEVKAPPEGYKSICWYEAKGKL